MKNTVRKMILLGMICFIPMIAKSQGGKKDSLKQAKIEELKQLRRELYTSKLALTKEESEKFFPIMEQYQDKKRGLNKEFRKKWKGKDPDGLTEAEAAQYLSDMITLREKELALFKSYVSSLTGILPAKKLVKLHKVEKEVNKELIRTMKEWKQEAKGNRKQTLEDSSDE